MVRVPISIEEDEKNNKQTNSNIDDDRSIVQQKENYNSDKYKVVKFSENHQMRDLYNRKQKLDYWIERIHTDLDELDKQDALKFLEIMQEKDQSILLLLIILA